MGVEEEKKKRGTKRKKLMWHIHLGTVRVSSTSTMCAILVDTMYNTYRTGSNRAHYFIQSIYYRFTHYFYSQIEIIFVEVISKLRTCKLVFVIKDHSINLVLLLF